MVLNRVFAGTYNENHILDARLRCLLYSVLHERFVNNREHLLRLCFGSRKEPSSKTSNGEYRLTNAHRYYFAFLLSAPRSYFRPWKLSPLSLSPPYSAGLSFPSMARRTIGIGGAPCFMNSSWNCCRLKLAPTFFL